MATSSPIDKLTALNFGTWRNDVKFLLLEKNCWDIVTGNEKEPVVSGKDADERELKDFKIRKRLALSILYLNISPEFRRTIEECDDPVQIWERLNKNFRPDNRSVHMMLFSELCECRIQPGESIALFASRIKSISARLVAIKQPINEIYLTFQLLRYLPDKYDQVVQGILRRKEEEFGFEDVLNELVAEESRLRLRDRDRKRGNAIEAHHVKTKLVCFRCGRPGHVKRFCKVKINQNRSPSASFSRNRSSSRNRNSHFNSRQQSKSPERVFKGRRNNFDKKESRDFCYVARSFLSSGDNEDDGSWVFDTAASHHFCRDRNLFTEFKEENNEQILVAIEDVSFPIEGRGTVKLVINGRNHYLKDVLYSPKLKRNLISGAKLDLAGFNFSGKNSKISVYKNNEFVLTATLQNGIYFIKLDRESSCMNTGVSGSHDKLREWHSKFAHANVDSIVRTSKNDAVYNLPKLNYSQLVCDTCKIAKHRRVTFSSREEKRSNKPLELLHVDVWGPSSVLGLRGEKYYLSITDDFSRKITLYPMFEKSEVFEIFSKHVARAERQLNTKLRAVRSDNGREFDNTSFSDYCNESGVKHEFTNSYTPEQNGVSEKLNQTVLNGVRAILLESNLERKFWPEALLYFSHVWNRLCHTGQTKTPIELYTGKPPSVKHLRPFGSRVFVGVPRQLRSKLDNRAKEGILVGYALRTKGYRVWLNNENKVIETVNVSFAPYSYLKPQSNSGAVMEPIFEFESKREDLAYVPSVEPEDSSCEEEVIEQNSAAVWVREARPRRDKSRTDIYYHVDGSDVSLNSLKKIKKYCEDHNLVYDEKLFSFKGTDTTVGIINPPSVDNNDPETEPISEETSPSTSHATS